MDKQWLEEQYLEKHLPIAVIAKQVGISRVAVWRWVKKFGFKIKDGDWVKVVCSHCGKHFKIVRSRWLAKQGDNGRSFCSKKCYLVRFGCSNYNPSRWGQKLARKEMEKHLARLLNKGEIVHHRNGNCNDNRIENLMLFESNSQHIAFHHRLRD